MADYTLHYYQPRLNRVEPHNIIETEEKHHFPASNDTDAFKEMSRFIGKGYLVQGRNRYNRRGLKLERVHPHQVLWSDAATPLRMTGT